jgi:hypothetical protein
MLADGSEIFDIKIKTDEMRNLLESIRIYFSAKGS